MSSFIHTNLCVATFSNVGLKVYAITVMKDTQSIDKGQLLNGALVRADAKRPDYPSNDGILSRHIRATYCTTILDWPLVRQSAAWKYS